jgi:uncharacterized membrane protein
MLFMKSIIILAIVTFLSGIIFFLTRKFHSKVIPSAIIFALSFFVGSIIPLSISNKMLLTTLMHNIAPSVVFLYALDFDIRSFLKNKIGCACKMGTKQYWVVVVIALAVSLATQIGVNYLYEENFIVTLGVALFIGFILSFTPLKSLNGTQEIATTMLYLLSAIVGLQLA